MSAEETPKWATGLTDAFVFQSDAAEVRRELRETKRRAQQAEDELAEVRSSIWWRVSGPLRRREAKRARPTDGSPRLQTRPLKGKKPAPTDRPHPAPQGRQEREAALIGRLTTVLREFDQQVSLDKEGNEQLPAAIAGISALVMANRDDRELAWLTYIALAAKFPRSEDMLRFHTDIKVAGAANAIARLLAMSAESPKSWARHAELELVRDVVVDPTSTSHRDFHTGIQRVVRETVSRWKSQHRMELMIWGRGEVFRPATPLEFLRTTELVLSTRPKQESDYIHQDRIRVPWRTRVVVPEPTSQLGRARALECLAEWSSNEVSAIFYDLIMYTLPETLNDSSRIGLTNFIPVVRTAERISTISDAVGVDLSHFTMAFSNLGLDRPQIVANLLPVAAELPSADQIEANRSRVEGVPGLPVVLSVGSLEPRKNQLMTLRAAEVLWNEGMQFQLVFIGWQSWQAAGIIAEIERVQATGRPVRIIRRADETLLWSAYSLARFTTYISLAEGYGLPIGESLAAGTPVITSKYGSMAEVAEYGGAVAVDPRNLTDVTDAMRTLLSEDDELAHLTAKIGQRGALDWNSYAEQTWNWLVDGVAK